MATSKSLKKSPLDARHRAAGARMVEFGGWEMPIQYKGILEEHRCVREAAGLFDISHMGEVIVTGAKSESWLNTVLSNDVRLLNPGESQYTLILNDRGGIIDDLLLYRIGDLRYLLVINASRCEEDLQWLNRHLSKNVHLEDVSSQTGALALQGPATAQVMDRAFPEADHLPPRPRIAPWPVHPDAEAYIARSGYTGEDGIELFFPNELAPQIWDTILDKGASLGCQPVGLGARDSLRLEASLPLYGNDLGPDHTPYESGVGFAVSFDKPEKFIGREALRKQKADGVPRKLIPFTLDEPGAPPRSGYRILHGKEEAGVVTSGGHGPTLACGMGLARVDSAIAKPGQNVNIDIRGRLKPATLQKRPLYKSTPSK